MWKTNFYQCGKVIGLLGFVTMIGGCAGTQSQDPFQAEGFRVSQPQPGSRVVVGGNHLEAVNRAIPWLNDHQLIVVNRWVDENLTTPKTTHGQKTNLQPYVLNMAQQAGAKLVVFVHADETQLDKTDQKNGGQQPMKMTGVEIQGIDVDTGEIAFGAMAWNSEPLLASKNVVDDLTVLALEQSWQESQSAPGPSRKLTTKDTTRGQETAPQHSASPESPRPSITTQSRTVEEPPPPTQNQVVVLPDAISHEAAPVSDLRQEDIADPTASEPHKMAAKPHETTAAPVNSESDNADRADSEPSPIGLQIASGALSVLYTPLKIVYAGLGGVFGGLVYVLTGGNVQAADAVWDASLHGSYWITPANLQGDEPLRFKGDVAP